ncbi:MAG: hypothetical protein Q8807_03020 ['Waltheria sp.' little leaf phytoplasma]|nr:hypothetical protein ['Waltheria sp.' little leaf phytoplasma]
MRWAQHGQAPSAGHAAPIPAKPGKSKAEQLSSNPKTPATTTIIAQKSTTNPEFVQTRHAHQVLDRMPKPVLKNTTQPTLQQFQHA